MIINYVNIICEKLKEYQQKNINCNHYYKHKRLYFIMIKNFFKGFIIGTGKIIPGVSGSMLAISLNVYEKLLNIIANIKKIDSNSFKFLFSISIGIIISITIFSKIIKWTINTFYIPIMFLFIGLILGGIPNITKEISTEKRKHSKNKKILIFIISFAASYIITQIGNINLSSNNNIIIFFILGLIEAFSSIVPGISGTAIYMSLGIYDTLLNLFSNLLNPHYIHITLLFGAGILIGTYIIAKLITYLLKYQKIYTFTSILGFMSSAIFIMFKQILVYISNTSFVSTTIPQITIGIIMLYIGTKLTIKINNISTNN